MPKSASNRRPSLGPTAIDAYVTPKKAAPAAAPVETPEKPPKVRKLRATFHVREDLMDEIRDCVVALSGPPYRYTLAAFAEDALKEKLESMKKLANKGKPFPKRGEYALRGGRPLGS